MATSYNCIFRVQNMSFSKSSPFLDTFWKMYKNQGCGVGVGVGVGVAVSRVFGWCRCREKLGRHRHHPSIPCHEGYQKYITYEQSARFARTYPASQGASLPESQRAQEKDFWLRNVCECFYVMPWSFFGTNCFRNDYADGEKRFSSFSLHIILWETFLELRNTLRNVSQSEILLACARRKEYNNGALRFQVSTARATR
jgi:hypothetical protein